LIAEYPLFCGIEFTKAREEPFDEDGISVLNGVQFVMPAKATLRAAADKKWNFNFPPCITQFHFRGEDSNAWMKSMICAVSIRYETAIVPF